MHKACDTEPLGRKGQMTFLIANSGKTTPYTYLSLTSFCLLSFPRPQDTTLTMALLSQHLVTCLFVSTFILQVAEICSARAFCCVLDQRSKIPHFECFIALADIGTNAHQRPQPLLSVIAFSSRAATTPLMTTMTTKHYIL